MTRWTAALATGAILGISLLVGGSMPATATPGDTTIVLSRESRGYADFAVEGQAVRGLYPGRTRQITLRVANGHGFPLRVLSLEGRLVATSRPGCPSTPSTLTINTYTGPLPVDIQAYSRRSLPGHLPVTMPPSATSRCADTTFTIELRGRAIKDSR